MWDWAAGGEGKRSDARDGIRGKMFFVVQAIFEEEGVPPYDLSLTLPRAYVRLWPNPAATTFWPTRTAIRDADVDGLMANGPYFLPPEMVVPTPQPIRPNRQRRRRTRRG